MNGAAFKAKTSVEVMHMPKSDSTSAARSVKTPKSLHSIITKLLEDGLDDTDEIASAAVQALTRVEREHWLHSLVLREVTLLQRQRVHRHEVAVRREIEHGVDPITARRALAADSFALPDGRRVPWLLATADEHLARAGWLEGQQHALGQTRALHEEAARLITENSVTCLADLSDIPDLVGAR